MMDGYRVVVFYSDEDGGYIASVPALRYCSAFGRTAAEARREIAVAMKLWLETARANGKPIPPPDDEVQRA